MLNGKGTVLISGTVMGNVLAADRIELPGTAPVVGDLEARVVIVEEGVVSRATAG